MHAKVALARAMRLHPQLREKDWVKFWGWFDHFFDVRDARSAWVTTRASLATLAPPELILLTLPMISLNCNDFLKFTQFLLRNCGCSVLPGAVSCWAPLAQGFFRCQKIFYFEHISYFFGASMNFLMHLRDAFLYIVDAFLHTRSKIFSSVRKIVSDAANAYIWMRKQHRQKKCACN